MKVRIFLLLSMNFFIWLYIILLSSFFFKKQNFIYIILSFLIIFSWFKYIEFSKILIFKEDYWFIFLLTWTYYFILEMDEDKREDINFLKFLIWLGSLIIILSSNIIIIYIGLEIQTFSLFILIAKNRNLIKSSEAGLKYFILGAISSGFYLISSIMLYSIYSSLDLIQLSSLYYFEYSFYVLIFIFSLSLFFKLSLFPLHFWIPDIYEGSSLGVLSIIATLPKISIICLVLKLNIPIYFLLYFGVGSIIIGSLGGLNQTKIKRLLAYSSISHLGFTILGLNLFGVIGLDLVLVYFLIYIITSLGILFLLVNFNKKENIHIVELSGLQFSFSLWGFLWMIFFLSLAGLPPLVGFLSKWWVITNLVNYNYLGLSIIVIIFSCVSIGFYLRISKIIYFQPYFSYFTWYSILYPKKTKNLFFYFVAFILYFSLFSIFVPNVWSSLVYCFWY